MEYISSSHERISRISASVTIRDAYFSLLSEIFLAIVSASVVVCTLIVVSESSSTGTRHVLDQHLRPAILGEGCGGGVRGGIGGTQGSGASSAPAMIA
jgi:hypothetical protein